jgi:hypothetical protein
MLAPQLIQQIAHDLGYPTATTNHNGPFTHLNYNNHTLSFATQNTTINTLFAVFADPNSIQPKIHKSCVDLTDPNSLPQLTTTIKHFLQTCDKTTKNTTIQWTSYKSPSK